MPPMRLFVTGGAGFIGSTLCGALLADGHTVVCFDDLSTGREAFLEDAKKNPQFRFVKGDIQNPDEIAGAMKEAASDWVVHLAANADVRHGFEQPRKDLDVNTLGTSHVLEAMRAAGVKNILFSSTSAVYGEPEIFPTPEDASFPEQTSLYGASKAAAEGIISAYAHGYGMRAIVFRFVSIVGPRYTHGHVFDFVKKLKNDPSVLEVLGDGNQEKSYLHIDDLIAGLRLALAADTETAAPFTAYNIGHDSALKVTESVAVITKRMGVSPKLLFTGGVRGWVGDSPRVALDTTKLRALGWKPAHPIERGITDTVDYLLGHPELFDRA